MLVACQAKKSDNHSACAESSYKIDCLMHAHLSSAVIIASHGRYDWLPVTVCSVAPKLTPVNVEYTSGINSTVHPTSEPTPDPDGPTIISAMNTLVTMVWYSQGIDGNVVGDHLTTIKTELKWEKEDMLVPLVALFGYSEGH